MNYFMVKLYNLGNKLIANKIVSYIFVSYIKVTYICNLKDSYYVYAICLRETRTGEKFYK